MTIAPHAQPAAPVPHEDGPRLLADIGGTNARFALEWAPGKVSHIVVLPCDGYATLAHALRAYLGMPAVAAALPQPVRHAGIAIANPVDGDHVRMTNHHWAFSIEALRAACGFDTLLVVNDFSALARSLPRLRPEDKRQVGGGAPSADAPLALLGAGTGLGVSGLVPCGAAWTALRSEGGHVSFSPATPVEVDILQFAWNEFDHVSAERLMSGDGIELIYRALAHRAGRAVAPLDAPEIGRRALAGECALCDETIDTFCGMLGTIAGNLAITLGAQGGVYIGGGIVPRLGGRFDASPFRARFERKGRFSGYLARVPTYVITADYPAFTGMSAMLDEELARKG